MKSGRFSRHLATLVAASVSATVLVAGCATGQRPIFAHPGADLTWPAAPAAPRIRYVGELRSAADLHAPQAPLARVGDLLAGEAEPKRLYGPRSVVHTADDRLWIADPGGRCLHLFDLQARRYRKIARVADAPLLTPVDVCLGDDDSLYVCDSEAVAIHRLSAADGTLRQTLRIPTEIRRPAALAWDRVSGGLLVLDSQSHDIKVLSESGELLRTIGRRGAGPGEFNFPCDLHDDGELIWVVDAGNQRVQGINRAGEAEIVIGQAGDGPGDFALPKSVATDSDGHLYVVDARFENVQVFDRQGRLLLVVGEEGSGPGEFWLPAGIHIDAADRIWICDTYNGRVQVFNYLTTPAARDASEPANSSGGEREQP